MPKPHEDLLREALTLPPEARADLAERLLDSITPPEHSDVDEAWAREAERRLSEYEAGKVQSIPADEVFRDLMLKRRK
jgi:putative addiction module component (TIGR02574 family)